MLKPPDQANFEKCVYVRRLWAAVRKSIQICEKKSIDQNRKKTKRQFRNVDVDVFYCTSFVFFAFSARSFPLFYLANFSPSIFVNESECLYTVLVYLFNGQNSRNHQITSNTAGNYLQLHISASIWWMMGIFEQFYSVFVLLYCIVLFCFFFHCCPSHM